MPKDLKGQIDGRRGVLLYAGVVIAGSTIVSLLLHARNLSVGDSGAGVLVIAAMWIPALARLAVTRTVDRAWRSPFPLRRWGHPRSAVLLVPVAIVAAIYLGAYGISWLAGVPRQPPIWQGTAVAINVALNLPLLAAIGLVGSLGEEIGWRGYLQPRLDQIQMPYSLLWVVALETFFHLPLILLAGYVAHGTGAAAIALFFGLKLGATPVWTWATYRWRTIWIAVWFHAFHNAVSQVLVPKALGVGDPLILGESGVLPVALYLLTAAVVFGIARTRGEHWRDLARRALASTASPRSERPT
jgi:membrane protease YdiL (CAAX protease family)